MCSGRAFWIVRCLLTYILELAEDSLYRLDQGAVRDADSQEALCRRLLTESQHIYSSIENQYSSWGIQFNWISYIYKVCARLMWLPRGVRSSVLSLAARSRSVPRWTWKLSWRSTEAPESIQHCYIALLHTPKLVLLVRRFAKMVDDGRAARWRHLSRTSFRVWLALDFKWKGFANEEGAYSRQISWCL